MTTTTDPSGHWRAVCDRRLLMACGAGARRQLNGRLAATTRSGRRRSRPIRASPFRRCRSQGSSDRSNFLWKLKLEYDPKAATALTQPILLDRIIGFRGFKSIAFVGHAIGDRARDRHRSGHAAVEVPHQLFGEPASGAERDQRVSGRTGGAAIAADRDCAGRCGRALVVASAAAAGPAAASVNRAKARSRWRRRAAARRWRGSARRTWRTRGRAGCRSRIRSGGRGKHAGRSSSRRARRAVAVDLAAAPSCPAQMRPTSSAATDFFMRSTCRTAST